MDCDGFEKVFEEFRATTERRLAKLEDSDLSIRKQLADIDKITTLTHKDVENILASMKRLEKDLINKIKDTDERVDKLSKDFEVIANADGNKLIKYRDLFITAVITTISTLIISNIIQSISRL